MKIIIKLKGYVCEIFCGNIPLNVIRAIAAEARSQCAKLEALGIKSSPQSAAADLWYGQSPEINDLMGKFGSAWDGFMSVNHFGCYSGIGSGKDGLGVFEMEIYDAGKLLLTFVPPPLQPELKDRFMGLDKIGIKSVASPTLPYAGEDLVPISSGLWGIGKMEFHLEKGLQFDPEALEFVTTDLCDIGIAEDCLTTGITYNGMAISGLPFPGPSREPYPVVWYSQEQRRWLGLGDNPTF